MGSLPVKIPVRSAEPPAAGDSVRPLAQLEIEGNSCAISVQGDPSVPGVELAVREAAEKAVVLLSRKLLN